MKTVNVNLADRTYAIKIDDNAIDRSGNVAREALGERARQIVIVSNPRVQALYGNRVTKSLKKAGFTVVVNLIGDGERAKSLATAERLWAFMIENRIERSDAIIALGGGVVGDLAGFVAATFLRGIEYIQIPTSLLAQIDSSVGGKTAINHRFGKNLIGAFHQPRAVIIDPLVLETLPRRELQAGLYEMLKYGVIRDREVFERTGNGELPLLIARCCEIKAEVVAADERESGLRQILNFGHTVGHALEAVTRYRRLKHGEAVGYGMKCAAMIATEMGICSGDLRDAIGARVAELGKLPRIDDLDPKDIVTAMSHDKKVANGRLRFILPERIGSMVIRDDVPHQTIHKSVARLLTSS